MTTDDTQILELSLISVTNALNDLVGAFTDADGGIKAPDYKALMQARSRLPPRCIYALNKKEKK